MQSSIFQQVCSACGNSSADVNFLIYRRAGALWSMELRTGRGEPARWEAAFDSDEDAIEAAMRAVRLNGIASFMLDIADVPVSANVPAYAF